MTIELLRRAAQKARTLAESATPSPWVQTGATGLEFDDIVVAPHSNTRVADADTSEQNAAYIAAMHPAVALAVANLLEEIAVDESFELAPESTTDAAFEVARALLGDDS